MLSSSACAPPRAFSPFRRVPLIVLHVEAGAPLVRAAGPRVNTAELREEWFESELAGWCRARGCIAGLEAAEAIPGEPFSRWIGAEVSHG